jgi:hypothetical protein
VIAGGNSPLVIEQENPTALWMDAGSTSGQMPVQPQDTSALITGTLGNAAKNLFQYAAPSHIQWLPG